MGKILHVAKVLLAVCIAEHGIRSAKGPYGLGKML